MSALLKKPSYLACQLQRFSNSLTRNSCISGNPDYVAHFGSGDRSRDIVLFSSVCGQHTKPLLLFPLLLTASGQQCNQFPHGPPPNLLLKLKLIQTLRGGLFQCQVQSSWLPSGRRERRSSSAKILVCMEPFCIMIDLRPGMILGPELTSGRNGIRQSLAHITVKCVCQLSKKKT
jgi:hypothetical protein